MLRWLYLYIIKSLVEKGYIEKDLIKVGDKQSNRVRLLKDIEDRIDLKLLWDSTIYLVDVVFDWIYIETNLKSEPKATDTLVLLARIFAGIGTFLYTLDAFDLVQWFCRKRCRVRPFYVSLTNLLLEDLAQASIAIYAAVSFRETRNAAWGINLATTIFAIVTKLVNILKSREGYTVPGFLRFTAKERPSITIEFLVNEKMEIHLSKLYDLYQKINRQLSEAKGDELQLEVNTDMLGGAYLVLQHIYEIQEGKSVEITFQEGSFIDLPQIRAFAVYVLEAGYDGPNAKSWEFDFRHCVIGRTSPDVKAGKNGWISLDDSDADCIVALLRYWGGLTSKVNLHFWGEQFKKVVLRPRGEQFDILAFTGLCKLLETDNELEELRIYNTRYLTMNEIASNTEHKKESFMSNDCKEMIEKMIKATVNINEGSRKKDLRLKWNDSIKGWGNRTEVVQFDVVNCMWVVPQEFPSDNSVLDLLGPATTQIHFL